MSLFDNSKPCVVGIGEALLDRFKDGTRKLGGAPMIFAYHAAQSNCNGVIVSAVKNDKVGNSILEELGNHNITSEYIIPVNKRSGTVEVDDTDPNDPKYEIKTDTAWTVIPNSNKLTKLVAETRAVYFGVLASFCGQEITKPTIDAFLDAVPKDCKKIFDVNLRWNRDKNNEHTVPLYSDELIIEYVEKCNVLKVNNSELEYVCALFGISGNSYEKKCERFLEMKSNVQILILTMGEDGSSIYWRDEKNEIATQSIRISVNLKNTVGAGDALAGAFIGELLCGASIPNAHYLAAQRSAHVCKTGVSMPQITRSDIFISYSRKDENVVVFFCNKFKEKGFTVWRDKNMIDYGDEFMDEIEKAIEHCGIFVYFSSKDANKSKYVKQEIQTAKKFTKRIVPIILDDTPFPKGLRNKLKSFDQKDFTLVDLTDFISRVYKEENL